METQDLGCWRGVNHSNSRSYCEDEQQSQRRKGKFSCFVICGAGYQGIGERYRAQFALGQDA